MCNDINDILLDAENYKQPKEKVKSQNISLKLDPKQKKQNHIMIFGLDSAFN